MILTGTKLATGKLAVVSTKGEELDAYRYPMKVQVDCSTSSGLRMRFERI
jgi:hypothetical protein